MKNKLVEISTVIPAWVVPVLKLFSRHFFFVIGVSSQEEIEKLINAGKFDEAEKLINITNKEDGESSFLTRLETRISRIRILGR